MSLIKRKRGWIAREPAKQDGICHACFFLHSRHLTSCGEERTCKEQGQIALSIEGEKHKLHEGAIKFCGEEELLQQIRGSAITYLLESAKKWLIDKAIRIGSINFTPEEVNTPSVLKRNTKMFLLHAYWCCF